MPIHLEATHAFRLGQNVEALRAFELLPEYPIPREQAYESTIVRQAKLIRVVLPEYQESAGPKERTARAARTEEVLLAVHFAHFRAWRSAPSAGNDAARDGLVEGQLLRPIHGAYYTADWVLFDRLSQGSGSP